MNKPTIGFIGMGAMGSRMARRLLDAGHSVTVFNRKIEATKPLADAGATVAGKPSDLGNCDVVLSMVFDEAAVESVLFGNDGVITKAKSGLTFIEMSTISPAASKRFHAQAARGSFAYLDCPVSGSTPQAEKGELIMLAGGDVETFERCKPILLVLGKAAELVGPAGSGSMAKLCINAMLAMGMQSLAEALALGERGGLDRHRLLELIGMTPIASPAQKLKFPNAEKDEYPPMFALRTLAKDLGLITDWAREMSLPLPAAQATEKAVKSAVAKHGEEDLSVLIRAARE